MLLKAGAGAPECSLTSALLDFPSSTIMLTMGTHSLQSSCFDYLTPLPPGLVVEWLGYLCPPSHLQNTQVAKTLSLELEIWKCLLIFEEAQGAMIGKKAG